MAVQANEKLYIEDKELDISVYMGKEPNNYDPLRTYRLDLPARGSVYITVGCTGNCQFGSLAYANNIFTHPKAKDIFKFINNRLTGKPMLLIDIQNSYVQKLEAIFTPDLVVSKTPYTSTNNSLMVLYLVNVAKLK